MSRFGRSGPQFGFVGVTARAPAINNKNERVLPFSRALRHFHFAKSGTMFAADLSDNCADLEQEFAV